MRCMQSIVGLAIFVVFVSSIPLSILAADDYPDISIEKISIDRNDIVEGDTVNLEIYIKNSGRDVSQNISVALIIDGNLTDMGYICGGLRGGIIKTINFSFKARAGYHYLRVIADYNNEIFEEDENNNELIRLIYAKGIKPDLVVRDVDGIGDVIRDGERLNLTITLENVGHRVNRYFYVLIKLGDLQREIGVNNALDIDQQINISTNLEVAGFGYKKISIEVDSRNDIEESNESNNIWERDVFVYRYLPWFNSSFHYRFLVVTSGAGLARLDVNFSRLLNSLNIVGVIDPDSFRVIGYSDSGSIGNRSVRFFLENKTSYNATLCWLTKDLNFYMVYFDVIENGKKNNSEMYFNSTKNTTLERIFDPEGWTFDIESPENRSLFVENYTCPFVVKSLADVNTSSIYVYRDNSLIAVKNMSSNNKTRFYSNYTLSAGGNYTFIFRLKDRAGYGVSKSLDIYVGNVDMKIENVTLPETLYENTPAVVDIAISSNIDVDNFTISLRVFHDNETEEFALSNISIRDVREVFSVSFVPRFHGYGWIEILLLLPQGISDKNYTDNLAKIDISVSQLPDIEIFRIFSPEKINEGSNLNIYTLVRNLGNSKVKSRVSLYVSKDALSWSTDERVFYRDIEISPYQVVNLSLLWKSPRSGRYILGLDVSPINIRDRNLSNNRYVGVIDVRAGDRTPPNIIRVWCEPTEDEIGYPIDVYAEVNDSSGIRSAILTLEYPDGKKTNISMNCETGLCLCKLKNLMDIGEYRLFVTVLDNSPAGNRAQSSIIRFRLDKDNTPPSIDGIWVYPRKKQMVNEVVSIGCIVSDNTGVEYVNITIIDPHGTIIKRRMDNTASGRYEFNDSFSDTGLYTFFISATDSNGNMIQSNLHEFWITENLNDTDGDGIPDWWEEMYGLNPYDPKDANGDIDGDGFTEIREYAEGLNPTKPNTIWGLSQYEMAVVILILIILIVVAVMYIAGREDML